MRVLIVGAGAIGGYFGARLLQAKRDVTFLVRPRRAEQLRKTGLVIRSPFGDVSIENPPIVQADVLRDPFDVILLGCKSYDLDDAMRSFAPAVGPRTAIIPVLNGMRHLETLEARFGREPVLGGHCLISSALDADGRILHLNQLHNLTFGERTASQSERAHAILSVLSDAGFNVALSESIIAEMWEKWIFISVLAGISCLMRASLGDIIAAGGQDLSLALLDECIDIANAAGYPPRDSAIQRIRGSVTTAGSTLMASMLRDLERGSRTEGDHILGDLLSRQSAATRDRSLLRLAYTHVKAGEARRARESSE